MRPARVSRSRLVAVGTLAAFLPSCGVRGAQVEQSPLVRVLERAAGPIAYVDGTGNIAVIDQKGGHAARLTTDAGESPGGPWPTGCRPGRPTGRPWRTPDRFHLDPERLYVSLRGFAARGGDSWTIAQYPVTIGTLQVLPFFDQYHRSLTIWSPDARTLVFTAYAADGSASVYVVPADGNVKPRRIAVGDTASWSPR